MKTMGSPNSSRDGPCPNAIIDFAGFTFAVGAVGGSPFYFFKGIYNSPKGERISGGAQAVRMNVPRTAGSFAIWGGLFSTFDCSLAYLRQKEDPWNPIFANVATRGLIDLRQGLRVASRSAVMGGTVMALWEGAVIMLKRVHERQRTLADDFAAETAAPAPAPSTSSSWCRG